MDETPETPRKNETKDLASPAAPRGRGRPRRRVDAFVKVEPVAEQSIEKPPALPDPRWMAEFVAAFLQASR